MCDEVCRIFCTWTVSPNVTGRDDTCLFLIQDQLQLGFIEKVPDSQSHTGVLHYIPHLPVFKQDSATTKMRIVYDASAKRSDNSLSLNGCLHAGPNLLQGLTGILLKFRVHPIAFVADIEKAFLQIELNAADRDATRFLWLKDVTQSARDLTNVEVFRFCRVLFGAAPSPFLLGATIHHHLDRHGGDWISQDLQMVSVRRHFYHFIESDHSLSLFFQTTSRIYVGFVMEKIGHLLHYLQSC